MGGILIAPLSSSASGWWQLATEEVLVVVRGRRRIRSTPCQQRERKISFEIHREKAERKGLTKRVDIGCTRGRILFATRSGSGRGTFKVLPFIALPHTQVHELL